MKAVAVLCWLTVLSGADKRLPLGQNLNENIQITAKAYTDREDIRRLLGAELDQIAVVEIELHNRTDKPIPISLDDFSMISDKDGARSRPFAPSQIAGSSALVVGARGASRGAMSDGTGPIWGGSAGGPPARLGGDGATLGNSSETSADASLRRGAGKPNPLLNVLKKKVLGEGELTGDRSGLLYFPIEGKLKPKNLELEYKGPAGRVGLRLGQ